MLLEPSEVQPLIYSVCVKKMSHGFETLGRADILRSLAALNLSLRGAVPGENLFGPRNCNFPAMAMDRRVEVAAFCRDEFSFLFDKGMSGILMVT